jgi:hypothetical protein
VPSNQYAFGKATDREPDVSGTVIEIMGKLPENKVGRKIFV